MGQMQSNLALYLDQTAHFGNGSDKSIRYSGGNWQTDSGTWTNISTVSGKWTVSGSTLILHRNFDFRNVTVPSGSTLVAGANDSAEYLRIRVSGTCTVGGIIQPGANLGGGGNPADRQTSDANGLAVETGYYTISTGQPGASGSGGGAAKRVGGHGRTRQGGVFIRPNAVPTKYPIGTAVTGTTTTGGNGQALTGEFTTNYAIDNAPNLGGAPGNPGGGGALNQSGTGSYGGAGGAGGRGGGVLRLFARQLVITGSINANGFAGSSGEAGSASGNNLTCAGGGGGAGGGGSGIVAISFGKLIVNGTDYTNDPYSGSVLAQITATGGNGGAGGVGKTRLDSATALTAWAGSTAYSLGTFRRKTIPDLPPPPDPTGATIKTVKPLGGGDFTTLQGWWDWAKTQTNPKQWAECYGGGSLGPLDLSGGTSFSPVSTDGNCPRIYPADGHRHNLTWDTSKAHIDAGTISTQAINIVEIEYFTVEGIQVRAGGSGAFCYGNPSGTNGYGSYTWDGLLLIAQGTNTLTGIYSYNRGTGVPAHYRNLLVYNCGGTGIVGVHHNAYTYIANCGIVDCAVGIHNVAASLSDFKVRNCYVTGSGTGFTHAYFSGTYQISNCFTTDTTLSAYTNSNCVTGFSLTGQVTNPVSDWVTLEDSDLVDAGLDLSADFGNDAVGNTRIPPWTAGPYQAGETFTMPTLGYVVIAAGTSASSEPTWPESANETISDGGVIWGTVAEGENVTASLFSGGAGHAGTDGVVILEKVGI
jgi:hypothetical protein